CSAQCLLRRAWARLSCNLQSSVAQATLDDNDTVMQPRNFQAAVFVRLGVPVLSREVDCSMCMQKFDILGDHAACCTKNGDLITRHNRVRNLLNKICT